MTLEMFKALTPWLTFALTIFAGIFSFVVSKLINDQRDLAENLKELTEKLYELDREHQIDQRKTHEKFVTQQSFYHAIGKQEGITQRIFTQINDLSAAINQAIGAMKVKEK